MTRDCRRPPRDHLPRLVGEGTFVSFPAFVARACVVDPIGNCTKLQWLLVVVVVGGCDGWWWHDNGHRRDRSVTDAICTTAFLARLSAAARTTRLHMQALYGVQFASAWQHWEWRPAGGERGEGLRRLADGAPAGREHPSRVDFPRQTCNVTGCPQRVPAKGIV